MYLVTLKHKESGMRTEPMVYPFVPEHGAYLRLANGGPWRVSRSTVTVPAPDSDAVKNGEPWVVLTEVFPVGPPHRIDYRGFRL